MLRATPSVLAILALSATASVRAAAQPPARPPSVPIPSAPLPSAPSDSIARMAIDPARFAGRPFVTLLDESQYRVEPDGRTVNRTRQVVQVLDQQVARTLSERAYGYAASHQSLRIDWVRVLKPTGEVVSDRAAQEQESQLPAAMTNPVYQDQKVRRLSLAGVAVGTIVDVAVTIEERVPSRAGDFLFRWNVNGADPIVRSRFVLDAPLEFTPRIVERNLNFRRTEVVRDGRRTLSWATNDVATFQPELFASDSNGVAMTITVAPPSAWSDIARWYATLARDRYTITPLVAARVDSLVRASGARTRRDTIRAVHRWVAQDIRYLSVALGIGGYQPRPPEETLTTGFGDCKDKTTLFVAAMRRYAIPANPVLLSLSGKPDRGVPTIFQFNHAIAAVRESDRAPWTFADLTAEYVPFGSIPPNYQGAFGIVVLPDGAVEETTFPIPAIDASQSLMREVLDLDSTGRATARITEEALGWVADGMRAALGIPLDSARRATITRSIAQRTFTSDATVDSLVTFDGKNFAATPRVTYRVVAPNVLKRVGEARLLPFTPAFLGPARNFRLLAQELESRGARRFPLDAAQILAPAVTITDIRITLPLGWKAELPKNVSTTSFFGSYSSTWTQEGGEVRLLRRVSGGRGIFPPERIAEVIVWLKTVGADDYEFLSLRPAPVH